MIFLRPWALLLLLVPILIRVVHRHMGTADNPWKKRIDKRLWPYVMLSVPGKTTRHLSFMVWFLWGLLSVALAGPAWRVAEVPAMATQPATVIVLDLSPAMTGKNLTQATLKLYDILTQLKGGEVALVLYGQKGYVAAPLTPDIDLVRQMVPALNPSVLPELAARPAAGFETADKLLQRAKVQDGRILLLTTGALGLDELDRALQNMPWRVGILGIGEADGAPIALPNGGFMTDATGRPLLIHLDEAALSRLGVYRAASPDSGDITALLRETAPDDTRDGAEKTPELVDIYQDKGIWLVLSVLPFFLLLFRRGAMFVIVFMLSFQAHAGWFSRPDEEAYQAELMAAKAYRAGDFETAKSSFQSAYNRGNALARQHKIPEALAAYEEALKQNPSDEDAAFNKAYLEKQMPPEAKEKNGAENEGAAENAPKADDSQEKAAEGAKAGGQQGAKEKAPGKEDASPENQGQGEDGTLQKAEETPDNATAGAEPPKTPDGAHAAEKSDGANAIDTAHAAAESDKSPLPEAAAPSDATENAEEYPLSLDELEGPFDQEEQALLNRLKKDPSRVLRYRLYQQYQGRTE